MEFELIERFRQRTPVYPCVRLGIGDDAAILDLSGQHGVVTVDVLMDGVDFVLSEIPPEKAGRKALAVNLSDLAAMAASPKACLVGMVLPRKGGERIAEKVYDGILGLAREYQVGVAGGDTNSWDGPLVLSVTAIGTPPPFGGIRRRGAKPGDRIVVTGEFGGSSLGKHLDFEPRVWEAIYLYRAYEIHAGIDVSDGLAADLAHILVESQCGAVIRAEKVPISMAALDLAKASRKGGKALDRALHDGEDFELILAVPPAETERMLQDQPLSVPLTDIGEFVAEKGLWLQTGEKRTVLEPKGFVHLFA
ncbi:MAG: thiamine-monophosphate kinase [Thermogutta sp.]|nr:thiamine-monophosphate kinase [Thermogutta sp.]